MNHWTGHSIETRTSSKWTEREKRCRGNNGKQRLIVIPRRTDGEREGERERQRQMSRRSEKWCNAFSPPLSSIKQVRYWKIIIDRVHVMCEHERGGLQRYLVHLSNWSSNIIGLFLFLASNVSRVTHTHTANSIIPRRMFVARDFFLRG